MSNVDQLMAVIDSLSTAVEDVKNGLKSVKSQLADGGGEDPRIANAVVRLTALHDALEASVANASSPPSKPGPTGPLPPLKALPPGCVLANVPGAPGLVHLTGPFVGQHWQNMAYSIDEAGDSFPEGSPEWNFVKANRDQANTLQVTEGDLAIIPACYPLQVGVTPPHVDTGSGTLSTAIPGTLSLPSHDRNGKEKFRTVAQAQAFYGSLADPR